MPVEISDKCLLVLRESHARFGKQFIHLAVNMVGLLVSFLVSGCPSCELGVRALGESGRLRVAQLQVGVSLLDCLLPSA